MRVNGGHVGIGVGGRMKNLIRRRAQYFDRLKREKRHDSDSRKTQRVG